MADKKQPNSQQPPSPDDWQKGIPYAKTTGPYTGPTAAAKRVSKVVSNSDGTATEITGGLQGVNPTPISADEFNSMARGGAVKSWERALGSDQQRRATRRTAGTTKPKANW